MAGSSSTKIRARSIRRRQAKSPVAGLQLAGFQSTAVRGHKRKQAAIGGERRGLRLPLSTTRLELLDEGGTTDHRFRQLLHDFSTLGGSLEMARAHLASSIGLTSPQYNIAMILANHHHAGGISVSDVARSLHVSTAFVTSEAGKLEQAGLVQKQPNPSDGRGVLLRLTLASEALVERVGAARQQINDHLFGSLTETSFRGLSKTLQALLHDFAYTLSLLKHGIMEEKQNL